MYSSITMFIYLPTQGTTIKIASYGGKLFLTQGKKQLIFLTNPILNEPGLVSSNAQYFVSICHDFREPPQLLREATLIC